MKVVTAEAMRELDRRTIEESGVPGDELMDRAGHGVADIVRRLSDVAGFMGPRVLLLAGRGNNGGDAFVAARYLKSFGFEVEVWLAAAVNQVKGDALKHLGLMRTAGIVLRELPTKEDWDTAFLDRPAADILVDGLLGTGTTGPARGPVVGAIEYIKKHASDALVVAIDLPSGLHADTGEAMGDTVCADVTITMALPKWGLVQPGAQEYVGTVEVVDIGVPPEYVAESAHVEDVELIYATDLKPYFPKRRHASHKGDYGHVLLVGGARGYAGAIAMAARAALRSGVGRVSLLVPESIEGVVAGSALEAMVTGGAETETGSLSPRAWAAVLNRLDDFSAILLGPGLSRHSASAELVQAVLDSARVTLVVDADALTVLGAHPEALRAAPARIVATPHPGELASLAGIAAQAIQADRRAAAEAMAERIGGTLVLKGAGTVVAESGRPSRVNMTGNPGMATGGTGDVLAGLLAGLLGQGMDPFAAACVSVYLHGRAGDMVAWRKTQAGLVAGDLIEELPYALRELTLR